MLVRKITILLLAFAASSSQALSVWNNKSYFGFDTVAANFQFKEGYGRDFIPTEERAVVAYGGYYFMDFAGFECGYEYVDGQSQRVTTYAGFKEPGNAIISQGSYNVWDTALQLFQPYLGFIGDYYWNFAPHTNLQGFIGVSYLKLKARQTLVDDEIAGLPTAADVAFFSRQYRKSILVPMFKLSVVHHMLTSVAVRGYLSYKHFSNFRTKSINRPDLTEELRLENMFSFGVGLSFNL